MVNENVPSTIHTGGLGGNGGRGWSGGRGGRGGQGNGQGNRNNGNGNNSQQNNAKKDKKSEKKKEKITGDCEELGDNVLVVNVYNQAERFDKVSKALFKYIKKEYTRGAMITAAIKNNTPHDMREFLPKPILEDDPASTATPKVGASCPSESQPQS